MIAGKDGDKLKPQAGLSSDALIDYVRLDKKSGRLVLKKICSEIQIQMI